MKYNKQMTHKERILSALLKKETDYSPCIVQYGSLDKVLYSGVINNFPWSARSSPSQIIKFNLDQLGISQVVKFKIPVIRPHKDVQVRVWKDGDTIYKQYDTPAGIIRAGLQYKNASLLNDESEASYDGYVTAHFKKDWITSDQDLECMKYVLRPWEPNKGEYEQLINRFKKISKYADENELPILTPYGLGPTICMQNIFPEKMCIKSVINTSILHEFLDLEHMCNKTVIDIAGSFGVDIMQRNGYFESSDYYSPQELDEFIGKRLIQEIKAIHQSDMKIIYTAHKNVHSMLDHIRKLKIDCIYGIDLSSPSVNLQEIKEKLFEKTALLIGPSMYQLCHPNNQNTIREVVMNIYSTFGEKGVILGPGTVVTSIMPWANILAMIDEWKKYR